MCLAFSFLLSVRQTSFLFFMRFQAVQKLSQECTAARAMLGLENRSFLL